MSPGNRRLIHRLRLQPLRCIQACPRSTRSIHKRVDAKLLLHRRSVLRKRMRAKIRPRLYVRTPVAYGRRRRMRKSGRQADVPAGADFSAYMPGGLASHDIPHRFECCAHPTSILCGEKIITHPKRPTEASGAEVNVCLCNGAIERARCAAQHCTVKNGNIETCRRHRHGRIIARFSAFSNVRVATHRSPKILFHSVVHFARLQQSERVDVNDERCRVPLVLQRVRPQPLQSRV